jgi:hypothetical protein
MGNTQAERLIFVYNANSGIGNSLLDGLHKTLSPSTYNCNLCAITFGVFSENRMWREFRQDTGPDMEFLHLDEFKERYPSSGNQYTDGFPQVFILKEGQLKMFLGKEEINAMNDPEDLIKAVQAKFG